MSGLKWIRLETTMFENLKLLYLKEDRKHKAIVLHLEAMCFTGRQGLAGFIPKAALKIIGATPVDARCLVEASLWVPVPGGWEIKDWDEYQVSDDAAVSRSNHARKAAVARWGKSGAQVED